MLATFVRLSFMLCFAAGPSGLAQPVKPVSTQRIDARSVIVKLPSANRPFESLKRLTGIAEKFAADARAIKEKVGAARQAYAQAPTPETETPLIEAMAHGLTQLVGTHEEVAQNTDPVLAELDEFQKDLKAASREIGDAIARAAVGEEDGKKRVRRLEGAVVSVRDRLLAMGYTDATAAEIPPAIVDAAATLQLAYEEEVRGTSSSAARCKTLLACQGDLQRAGEFVAAYRSRIVRIKNGCLIAAHHLSSQAGYLYTFCEARRGVHAARAAIATLEQAFTQLATVEEVTRDIDFSIPIPPGDQLPPPPAGVAAKNAATWVIRFKPTLDQPPSANADGGLTAARDVDKAVSAGEVER